MLLIDQRLIKASVWLYTYLVSYVALDQPAVVLHHYIHIEA